MKPHQPPSLCQYDIIFTIFPNPTFPETLFSHPLHLSCLFCQGCSPSKTNSSASALECLWKPGTVISLDNTPASAWSVIYIIDHKSQKEKPPLSRVAGPCWIGSQEQLRGSPPEGPPRWGQGGSPSRSNKGSPHPRSPQWGWGEISSPRTPGWYSEEATAPRSWLCGLVCDCGSQELERRRWVLLGFVARIAGFRPDSPSRAGCKPRGHRKTLGSYTRPLAMPAQPAGDQPGLAGQGELWPRESRPLCNYRGFFFTGARRHSSSENGLQSKLFLPLFKGQRGQETALSLSKKFKNAGRFVCFRHFGVSCCPCLLTWGSPEPPTWLQGRTQASHHLLLAATQ